MLLFACGYVTRRKSPLDGLQLSQRFESDSYFNSDSPIPDAEPQAEPHTEPQKQNLTVTPNYFPNVTKEDLRFGGWRLRSDAVDGARWLGNQNPIRLRAVESTIKSQSLAGRLNLKEVKIISCSDYVSGL